MDSQQSGAFDMISKLDLGTKGYSISECRDMVNRHLTEELHVDNRRVKDALIERFGDSTCFAYSNLNSKSQMLYSRNIATHDLANMVRSKDPIQ